MLNAHPAVRCRGEGLFLHHLAVPLERMMAARAQVIETKNRDLFRHTGGFVQFAAADIEHLVGTAILLALGQYAEDCQAIGEKTPENVFFFPRLAALFPQARFIAIARDPRDVVTSAWHFFGRHSDASVEVFVRKALPSMDAGARAMLAFAEAEPARTRLVTYEALLAGPAEGLADLFALLGVAATPAILADIVAATSFGAMTGGRRAGAVEEGNFLRHGGVGAWRQTLAPALAAEVIDRLGWMFTRFGWER